MVRRACIMLLIVVAACQSKRGDIGLAPTPEQVQHKAQYEQLVRDSGCASATLDHEWNTYRRVPVPSGGDVCAVLGRFGVPDHISTDAQSTTLIWFTGHRQSYGATLARTGEHWQVVHASW